MARAVSLDHQDNSPHLQQQQQHQQHQYLEHDPSMTPRGPDIRRDPVVILAMLEVDLWNADPMQQQQQQQTPFLTKLRIRASDLIKSSTTKTSSIKDGAHDDATTSSDDEFSRSSSTTEPMVVTCTAKQLYTKIRQHLAGGAPTTSSHIALDDGVDDLDVFIFDPSVGGHVPLLVSSSSSSLSIADPTTTMIDDGDDIVARFGTRLRIRLTERPRRAVPGHPLPMLTWRHYNFDGTLPVRVTRTTSRGDETTLSESTAAITVPLTFAETPNQPNAGTGFNVWDGALLLSHFLQQQPEVVRGRRVLELGAGCGVAGITAAVVASGGDAICDSSSSPTTHVTLTDLPEVLPLLRSNVERNRQHVAENNVVVTCEACDWFHPSRELLVEPWDVILVADCVWLQDLVAPLFDVLKRLTDDTAESSNKNVPESSFNVKAQDSFSFTESMATRRVSVGMDRSLTVLEATGSVDDTSPVCSMADIYKQRLRNNNRSLCMSKEWDGEASCGSLQDHETTIFSKGSAPRHSRFTEQPYSGRTSICVSDLMAGLNAVHDSDHSGIGPASNSTGYNTHGPTVLISYQRRGKATHDAFFQGLHELFRHVELLEPPNMDIPEVFYLLLCQR